MHHLKLKGFARCINAIASSEHTTTLTDRQLLHGFAAEKDQDAFAALVKRHGQMVLRVCRRVLRQEQDAEDAFQATFLVLARNYSAIRNTEGVASWLHGVAHRIALRAKRNGDRRRTYGPSEKFCNIVLLAKTLKIA